MVKKMENQTIILAVSYENENVRIRIDRNGLANPDFEPNPVTVLDLNSCINDAKFRDVFSNSIGKYIEFDVQQNGDGFHVTFIIDYRDDDEFTVNCSQFHSSSSDYTFEELKTKSERLAGILLAEQRMNTINSFLYETLLKRIRKEAQKEIDLCQRKIGFFIGKDDEKANQYAEIIKFYQRLLSITGLDDHQNLRDLVRNKLINMWDKNGVEYQIEQNRQTRTEIIRLGDAAIFPLLEMLTNSTPLIRKEVFNFSFR